MQYSPFAFILCVGSCYICAHGPWQASSALRLRTSARVQRWQRTGSWAEVGLSNTSMWDVGLSNTSMCIAYVRLPAPSVLTCACVSLTGQPMHARLGAFVNRVMHDDNSAFSASLCSLYMRDLLSRDSVYIYNSPEGLLGCRCGVSRRLHRLWSRSWGQNWQNNSVPCSLNGKDGSKKLDWMATKANFAAHGN